MVKKIAVVTTGGDCPGLNAAIRAVVRSWIYYNLEVCGVLRGYEGLIDDQFIEMSSHSVSNILQRGGTILKTARSERFRTAEGRQKAFQNISKRGVDALIVLGGVVSFRGIEIFTCKHTINVIGIPKTIDNYIYGTDNAIGYDIEVKTVVQKVNILNYTADAPNN